MRNISNTLPSSRVTSAPRWGSFRMALVAQVVLVLAAMLLCAFFLVRVLDARTQAQLVVHQTQEADLWARMLTARMEAHQRLLTSIAEGMHTSLLDNPAVLDALMQQDGSMLRLFDSLHVALPAGGVTHHGAVGAVTEVDSQGMDALRRTIAEGKPFVTHVPAMDDSQHLRVLLSVPMRREDGRVSGALAAMVKLPLAALMPDAAAPLRNVQYILLDRDGLVLAHSDVMQRWKNISNLVAGHENAWQALSNPSAANADTQQWGHFLVSRVGLPLPQWQVVIWRDTAADLLVDQGLPVRVWVALAAGAALLSVLAAALTWGWLAPWPGRSGAASPPSLDEDGEAAAEPGALDYVQRLSLQAGAMAMFEAVPSAMLLEHEGRITLATPQVAVMLGYFGAEAEQPTMAQLFESTAALDEVRHTLVDLGSFEGAIELRKKDGDVVQVDALAWIPSQLSSATVWRLQLPWRLRRSLPLPENESAWRDGLTGMPNREAFMWGLQSWVSDSMQTEKTGQPSNRMPTQGCLLFADLDHLGMMNETTSREMGNKMLRHVGRLIASYTQPVGSVARLGGDEFAVLLPGISLAHAQGVGQALCDAVWRWQPSWGGERHWVSISVGIVAMDALRHTPQQAVRAADMACYEAKRRGRCQVAVGQITAQPSLET